MILSYRQRLLIHNKIHEVIDSITDAGLDLSLNTDAFKLEQFCKEILENDKITFEKSKD